jgi:DNA repair protein RecN (Recombination protein N)
MLVQLRIENFALIKDLTLDFSSALNVLTGETGAGKSILIDGIRFVLGERTDQVRLSKGNDVARVEAVFELTSSFIQSHAVLEPFINEEESIFILRRELYLGKTKCWVNNRASTLATLKEIGTCLLDIHGQYDHQLLLDQNSHLGLVDRFAKLETEKKKYHSIFLRYDELIAERTKILLLEEDKERELDLLKYQVSEIEKAGLEGLDEAALIQEKIRLANSEKLHELTRVALASLNDGEPSASSLVSEASRAIRDLARLDESLKESIESEYNSAQSHLEEVIHALRNYQDDLTFDADRLEEIEGKMRTLEVLKRKYGTTVSEILTFLKQVRKKCEALEDTEYSKREITKKIDQITPELKKHAAEISRKRKEAAKQLKVQIESELSDLNIPKAVFEAQFSEASDFLSTGKDEMEFLIRLNVGQPLLPLTKIISGGEASRVMLAMKKALTRVDPVPTLIFDEIDTNIGGRLGQITGKKLKKISRVRQVLLITHLPQIASFADKHFKVSKRVAGKQTVVDYQVLEGDEKVRELSQMMSGKKETEISREHAKELLRARKKV